MLNGPSGWVGGEIGRKSERERSNGPRGGWREKGGGGGGGGGEEERSKYTSEQNIVQQQPQ